MFSGGVYIHPERFTWGTSKIFGGFEDFVFPFQRADFQDVFSCEQVMKVLKQKMGRLFLVMDKVMKGWNIPGKLVRESFWGFCPF